MGICEHCHIDTGWFHGSECDKCELERQPRYEDEVEIIDGFYKGQEGHIVEKVLVTGSDTYHHEYSVRIEKGIVYGIMKYELKLKRLYQIKEKNSGK